MSRSVPPRKLPATAPDLPPRRVEDFNRDWRFAKGAQPGAEATDFDAAAWAAVRLPHDWAIAGPYEPQGDAGTGKLPWRGEGWYRKTFTLPATDAGRRVFLDFDGVMAMPTVYVNGRKAGESNVVAVRADTRPHLSRWYPGGGIYRKVQLVVTAPVAVAQWGTVVTTPALTEAAATANDGFHLNGLPGATVGLRARRPKPPAP